MGGGYQMKVMSCSTVRNAKRKYPQAGIMTVMKCGTSARIAAQEWTVNDMPLWYWKWLIKRKPCAACKHERDCSMGWCDAIKDRHYNIRDGKDCWTAKDGE